MATKLIIVRHGETAWNRGTIYRGTHDVPLNDNGRRQAQLTAAALQKQAIDAAYTSPLSRASETAQIVLEPHGIIATDEDDLLDFDYGEWTGKEEAEVRRIWPAEYSEWSTRPHEARPPGGTTLEEIYNRCFPMMVSAAKQHDGGTVALFSHRVVNKLLVLGALGLGLERFPFIVQGNCAINTVLFREGEFTIESLNGTAHLIEGGVEVLEADF
jgi:broad specificity phosphatase PhoE